MGAGLDRRLRREDERRGLRFRGELLADEVGAEAHDLEGLGACLLRMRRPRPDDRERVAGDQDEVGLPARVHDPERAVEHTHLVGVALHVVVAEGGVGLGVHEDEASRADDAARGQAGREVGHDREPAETRVRHEDRDVGLRLRGGREGCRLLGAGRRAPQGAEDEDRGRNRPKRSSMIEPWHGPGRNARATRRSAPVDPETCPGYGRKFRS